jgi:hypothetical protein
VRASAYDLPVGADTQVCPYGFTRRPINIKSASFQ